MAADLLDLTALDLARQIATRAVSPVEVVKAVHRRLDATEPLLRAFVERFDEAALADARAAEREIAAGRYRGPLHGIPLAVKDNIALAGTVTAAGAAFLRDNVTPEDAECVRRLRAVGAIVVGKTNLHELAMGGTTDNPHFGTTRNPWGTDRVPGGSSGGSAAAVAARQLPLALGTDSAGSVRMPATYCGLVGVKPTHGRVSQRGLVASLTVTTDHIGPLTRTVADAALMLDTMAGHDPKDAFSRDRPVAAHRAALGPDLRGTRVGVPANFYFDLLEPEVDAAVRAAISQLQALGATLVEVTIPDLEEIMPTRIGLSGEGLAFLTPYLRAHPERISPELRHRLYASHFVLARDYARTNRVRRLVQERFAAVLRDVDLIAAPTAVSVAFPIKATSVPLHDYRSGRDVDQPVRELTIRLTAPANLTGHPALSVPCGFTTAGLPIGLQLMGRPWEEARLLAAAHAYEQATPWHARQPALAAAPAT